MLEVIPVSVVIPCFRCMATIGRAIQSIIEQTQQPAEVILVDDASGDGTLSVLQQWGQQYPGWIKLIELELNSGAGSARNAGWNVASQPYIAFLDADDSWHPNKLAIQYKVMTANPAIAVSGHRCVAHDSGQPSSQPINIQQVKPWALLFKNRFNTPTVMLKRDVNFRFVDHKRYAEDYYLWLQIAFSGSLVMFIDSPLSYIHKPVYGKSGLSANLWAMEKGELDGFYRLYQHKHINFIFLLIAVIFSLLKFCKRVVIVKIWRP